MARIKSDCIVAAAAAGTDGASHGNNVFHLLRFTGERAPQETYKGSVKRRAVGGTVPPP